MHGRTVGLLWVSFFAALLIHVTAIFMMEMSDFAFYSRGKAYVENRRPVEPQEVQTRKLDDPKRRTAQLAAIFKEISGYHSDEILSPREYEPLEEKTLLDAIEDGKGNLAFDANQFHQLEENKNDFNESFEAFPAETSSVGGITDKFTSFRQQRNVEYLTLDEDSVDDELIKAAMLVRGDVWNPMELNKETLHSISAGADVQMDFIGNSLQSRSGMIHEGSSQTLFGGGDHITAGDEPGVLRFTGLHQQPGMGFRNPILPAINKDQLRGFEAPTVDNAVGSDDFDLNVEYALASDGNSYIFKLILQPKSQVRFRKIAQNYFFLIDRSHSIRYLRYLLTKRAVVNALDKLTSEDTFNILLFDDKIEKFSPHNVKWTPENIEKAKQWLLPRRHGGIYGSTDLYASLGDIVPEAVADNEVNTAILFSDGDTYLGSNKQRKAITAWEQRNSGKVSLFAIATGGRNNLELLRLLTYVNKGRLYYASADADLEITLLNALDGIGHPIGKEIVVTALLKEGGAPITFYPERQHLPDLYESVPYVVYGMTRNLNDFDVFFQGRHYDKSLDIRQKVSFEQARIVPREILENELKNYIKTTRL